MAIRETTPKGVSGWIPIMLWQIIIAATHIANKATSTMLSRIATKRYNLIQIMPKRMTAAAKHTIKKITPKKQPRTTKPRCELTQTTREQKRRCESCCPQKHYPCKGEKVMNFVFAGIALGSASGMVFGGWLGAGWGGWWIFWGAILGLTAGATAGGAGAVWPILGGLLGWATGGWGWMAFGILAGLGFAAWHWVNIIFDATETPGAEIENLPTTNRQAATYASLRKPSAMFTMDTEPEEAEWEVVYP